jgi:DNA-binding LacI/PurR family transcriptional regulator
MATIHDVARLAGVGHTTVSHALSGRRPVAPATRARVLAAVRQLGYQPNAAARSLVSRRTRIVGLIAPLDLHDEDVRLHGDTIYASNYGEFILATGDRLNAHDYRLLCLVTREADATDVRTLVRSGQVDGMLLLQVRANDVRVAALRAEGIPFVTIGRSRDAAGVVRADADFARAAELAVEHLLQLGHRRIGFLTRGDGRMPVLGLEWHALTGFRRAHRAHGLAFDSRQVLYHESDQEQGLAAALAPFVGGGSGLTALVAARALDAALAQQMLAAHGLRIPEDVSMISLNDSGLTMLAQPPITVVRFSPTSLTSLAVDLLVSMLEGRHPPRLEHLVPVELVVRGSAGPAAPKELELGGSPERGSFAPDRGGRSAGRTHAAKGGAAAARESA